MYDTAAAASAAHTAGVHYRPAGARPQPRPQHADPDPMLQSETATAEMPPSETIPAGQGGASVRARAKIAVSGFRVRAAAARLYWTPPAVFTDRPASLQELAEYARRAPWTHQQSGFIRSLGVGWYRYVAYPKTVKNRYSEWAWQRPGRLLAHLGVIKLVSMTGPGNWLVEHVVYPAAQTAGHIFL